MTKRFVHVVRAEQAVHAKNTIANLVAQLDHMQKAGDELINYVFYHIEDLTHPAVLQHLLTLNQSWNDACCNTVSVPEVS